MLKAACHRQGKSFFNHEPTQQYVLITSLILVVNLKASAFSMFQLILWLIYCTMFLWFQFSAIKDTFGEAKKASLGTKRVEQVKVTT